MSGISFDEIDSHLLQDSVPSYYLNAIAELPGFKEFPYKMLYKLKTTEQSPIHHPEGNVWNHTMLVVDAAAKIKDRSNNRRVLMWAALLHDIGKPKTTKVRKGRITSYDHDKIGADLAEKFLIKFTEDIKFISEVVAMVRWHMQILFALKKFPFADLETMKREVDVKEIALLGLSDRLGRLGADTEEELDNIKKFLKILNN